MRYAVEKQGPGMFVVVNQTTRHVSGMFSSIGEANKHLAGKHNRSHVLTNEQRMAVTAERKGISVSQYKLELKAAKRRADRRRSEKAMAKRKASPAGRIVTAKDILGK